MPPLINPIIRNGPTCSYHFTGSLLGYRGFEVGAVERCVCELRPRRAIVRLRGERQASLPSQLCQRASMVHQESGACCTHRGHVYKCMMLWGYNPV